MENRLPDVATKAGAAKTAKDAASLRVKQLSAARGGRISSNDLAIPTRPEHDSVGEGKAFERVDCPRSNRAGRLGYEEY